MNRAISGNKSNPSSLLLSNRKKSIIKKYPPMRQYKSEYHAILVLILFLISLKNDINIQKYEKYGKMTFQLNLSVIFLVLSL